MFSKKIKLFITKLQNLIIFLSFSILTYSVVVHLNNKNASEDCFPEEFNKYLHCEDTVTEGNGTQDASVLWAEVAERNERQLVRNLQEFGPVRSDTPLLVVRVHRALRRLRLLVASLARVAGVDGALLVFSHSHCDRAIDRLVHQIDFCMVLQIFYPNSVQLYPDTFPGFEPENCANGTSASCSGRDPLLAEPKHHWWWTADYVFERLLRPAPPAETVVFLDESSYVLPDLMYMLGAAKRAMRYFPDADVISLGRAGAAVGAGARHALALEPWRPAHADGLALDRSTWARVAALGWHYCEYDDTSWAHSLQHVFRWFPAGRALALAASAPRVLSTRARRPRRPCAEAARAPLFPRRVQAVALYAHYGRAAAEPDPPGRGDGGWSDRRDVFQCYEVTLTEENGTTAFPNPD